MVSLQQATKKTLLHSHDDFKYVPCVETVRIRICAHVKNLATRCLHNRLVVSLSTTCVNVCEFKAAKYNISHVCGCYSLTAESPLSPYRVHRANEEFMYTSVISVCLIKLNTLLPLISFQSKFD